MNRHNSNLPSNRKFGFTFAVIFLFISIYLFWAQHYMQSTLCAITSFVLFAVTLINDNLLLPLNLLWSKIGNLLGKVISPIVLGIIYFGLFTPIAFLMRLAGRDELKLKKQESESCWQISDSAPPDKQSFRQQF